MALEKKITSTLFQRFKTLVLGKEKPNLITRISVTAGFIVWVYLASWHLLTLLSLLLMGNLKQSSNIRSNYGRIGDVQYDYADTITRLNLYSIAQLVIYLIILTSLVLIYRRKKIGLLLHVSGYLLSLIVTFLLMGIKFMANEISIIDYSLMSASLIYFSIGLFIFYRKNDTNLATDNH